MDSVIRGVAIYLALLVMTRLSGRRTLAQTTPFDFVLLLIIAETTQQALLGDDFSIVNAVVLMITLVTVDVILSFAKMRSTRLATWLDGTPTVLMSRGEVDRAATEGVMPPQMSYSGLNFDILTGVTALLLAVALATGRAGRRTAAAWNVLGSVLLLNILVIAFLSTPLPIRVFMNEPANVWITRAPFVWLPTVMVCSAIIGHIAVLRRVRAEAVQARTRSAGPAATGAAAVGRR